MLSAPSGASRVSSALRADTFTLLPPSAPGANSSAVTLDETGIAWPSDLKKFVDPTPAQKSQNVNTTLFLSDLFPTIQNVTNEHFIVWMRVAALPNFRKLYGRINTDIPAGTTLQVRRRSSARYDMCCRLRASMKTGAALWLVQSWHNLRALECFVLFASLV